MDSQFPDWDGYIQAIQRTEVDPAWDGPWKKHVIVGPLRFFANGLEISQAMWEMFRAELSTREGIRYEDKP